MRLEGGGKGLKGQILRYVINEQPLKFNPKPFFFKLTIKTDFFSKKKLEKKRNNFKNILKIHANEHPLNEHSWMNPCILAVLEKKLVCN